MQIPLVQGRDLNEHDDVNHERVVLINESFGRQFFPRSNPLGKRILEGYGEDRNSYRIVGVVGDARRDSPDIPPIPEVFLPVPQVGPDALELVIRTELQNPSIISGEIIRAARQLDPDVPLYDLRSMKWYFDFRPVVGDFQHSYSVQLLELPYPSQQSVSMA
jgi:MacB-like periplasmic core domain